ncbi:MAG: diacylglycerol kinase family lipid kinase [Clostridiaceae bacterium]|nr:diacylglycerol kinase family lipid kinase [Clostridiaceae bacterium]
MKIKFIINPVAGKGKALGIKDNILNKLINSSVSFSLTETAAPGDGIRLAKKAVIEKYDIIVAVGGDGTVNEVINGMVGSNAALGIIPAGTGNDFAKSLNIPADIDKALDVLLHGKEEKIDIGKACGKYFMNVASIGFDAKVIEQVNTIKKYISGTWSYIIAVFKTLLNYKPIKVRVSMDGMIIDKEVFLIAIANGKYYGGGMMIAPHAHVNDGYLDICIISKISKLKVATLFPTIFKGKHIHQPEVECFKAKKVEVFAKGASINCDGELIGKSPTTFQIENIKLNVMVG